MTPWKIFNQKWIVNSCQFSMVSWVILGKYVGRTKMISKIKVKFTTKKPFSSYISVDLRKGPAGSYMFKVNNRNTRARYEICSKLKIKIPIVVECFYCWLWKYFTSCSSFSIDNFEQVNAGWERFTSNASPNSESERFLKMLQDASYIKKIHMLRPHHTETLLVF